MRFLTVHAVTRYAGRCWLSSRADPATTQLSGLFHHRVFGVAIYHSGFASADQQEQGPSSLIARQRMVVEPLLTGDWFDDALDH